MANALKRYVFRATKKEDFSAATARMQKCVKQLRGAGQIDASTVVEGPMGQDGKPMSKESGTEINSDLKLSNGKSSGNKVKKGKK